jgi:hypothetical protein
MIPESFDRRLVVLSLVSQVGWLCFPIPISIVAFAPVAAEGWINWSRVQTTMHEDALKKKKKLSN